MDFSEATPSLFDVKIVQKFQDVIPEDLPNFLPDREVEFSIELVSGTTLISKTPYKKALAELKELKEQLQELLDKFHPTKRIALESTNFICKEE